MTRTKKWKFTGNEMEINGKTVKEIIALIDFTVAGTTINKGQIGGWLENERNLSQYGNCWVFRNCVVFDNAFVKDNAILRYGAVARDSALIYGDAIITESLIADHGKVGGHGRVTNAAVYDSAEIIGNASLTGEGIFHPLERQFPQEGDTYIAGFAQLDEYAQVYNGPMIYDYAIIRGRCKVFGPVRIHEEAIIEGNAKVFDHAEIKGGARINLFEDVMGNAVIE